jgi:hypothetical protein
VRELVRVEDRSDRDHDTVGDLERGHPDGATVGVVEDDARIAIDQAGR